MLLRIVHKHRLESLEWDYADHRESVNLLSGALYAQEKRDETERLLQGREPLPFQAKYLARVRACRATRS